MCSAIKNRERDREGEREKHNIGQPNNFNKIV